MHARAAAGSARRMVFNARVRYVREAIQNEAGTSPEGEAFTSVIPRYISTRDIESFVGRNRYHDFDTLWGAVNAEAGDEWKVYRIECTPAGLVVTRENFSELYTSLTVYTLRAFYCRTDEATAEAIEWARYDGLYGQPGSRDGVSGGVSEMLDVMHRRVVRLELAMGN
jgi:hypothetical protein